MSESPSNHGAPVIPLHRRRQQHHYKNHTITISYRITTRDFSFRLSHTTTYTGHASTFDKALARAKQIVDQLEGDPA